MLFYQSNGDDVKAVVMSSLNICIKMFLVLMSLDMQRSFTVLFFSSRHSAEEISAKRVVIFSYGSGLASSMFSMRFCRDTSPGSALNKLVQSFSDLTERLDSRLKVAPSEFEKVMKLRQETHHLGRIG